MSEDDIHSMAMEIASHHRLDPMTRRDRCICGYETELGRLFTEHIAKFLVSQGWRKG